MHLFQLATASPFHTGLECKWHPIMLKPKRTPGLTLTNSAFNQCRYWALELRAQMWSDPYFWCIIQSLVYYQFSRTVVSDSLRPHESQHTRSPCPSPTAGVHSDSHPSSQWCHPAISSSVVLFLPPIPPSIRVFSNESTLRMRWPEYWSFSFIIIPCKEIPGLISFIMDWLDLLAVQGTLKSLLQHHSSKASILQRSDFFTVQLSHPYMTTWKTIALTRQNFVGKVMFLLLNMLSRLVITFLPRSKCLLISWMQSPNRKWFTVISNIIIFFFHRVLPYIMSISYFNT